MISYPLRINNVDTRAVEAGASREPIVLVHGTADRAERGMRNIDALAAAVRDFLVGTLGRHQAAGVEYH